MIELKNNRKISKPDFIYIGIIYIRILIEIPQKQ